MAEDKWIWVKWVGNGNSTYNGKTHKVPKDTLVDPTQELKPGDSVIVHWASGKRMQLCKKKHPPKNDLFGSILTPPPAAKKPKKSATKAAVKIPVTTAPPVKKPVTMSCKFLDSESIIETPKLTISNAQTRMIATQTPGGGSGTSVATQTYSSSKHHTYVYTLYMGYKWERNLGRNPGRNIVTVAASYRVDDNHLTAD